MKSEKLKAMRMKNIDEVLEEDEVLFDTHFFNEFNGTERAVSEKKSSLARVPWT